MSSSGRPPHEPGDALAPRSWVRQRIEAWIDAPTGPPMLVVRGDPGSGKSSTLLQVVADRPAAIVTSIVREPGSTASFDSLSLLGSLIEGLEQAGIQVPRGPEAALPPGVSLDVHLDVGEIQSGGNAIGAVLQLATASGILPIAERLVRAVPAARRLVVVVDALDQAQDDGADEFLATMGAILRAAEGTGLRLLCASRRELPLGFDERATTSFDLVRDAPATDEDLRRHLERLFADLPDAEHRRAVRTILDGAADNWLWATTNARTLRAEIDEHGALPATIELASGLDGLYRDGVRQMRRRLGDAWETAARSILAAVACAFDDYLTATELRWITGLGPAQIEDVVRTCEPFLQRSAPGVRLFHPDFARWLLAGNVPGASEESAHLAVARGFTAFGHDTRWADPDGNAASRVVEHWCAVLVMDPFSPTFHEHEQALASVLENRDWAQRTDAGFDAIRQAGLVAPTLSFPGTRFPLRTGLLALARSPASHLFVGQVLAAQLTEAELAAFQELPNHGPEALRWLHEHLPGYQQLVLRSLWSATLDGAFHLSRSDGKLVATLTPDAVLQLAGGLGPDAAEQASDALEEVSTEHLDTLLERLATLADGAMVDPLGASILLADGHGERAKRRGHDPEADTDAAPDAGPDPGREDRFAEIEHYRNALRMAASDDRRRLQVLAGLADALRRLSEPTDADVDELVACQTEIVDRRRENADPGWAKSLNLLGDAYRGRAARRDGDAATGDLRQALACYRQALESIDSDDRRYLMFATDAAEALAALPHRSEDELDELIVLRGAALERRSFPGMRWGIASNQLGSAHRERARRVPDAGTDDTAAALFHYRRAVLAVPAGDGPFVGFAKDMVNVLVEMDERSDPELAELLQLVELIDVHESETSAHDRQTSALILGNAYFERALRRSGELRDQDLRLALEQRRPALLSTDEEAREIAVFGTANALLALEHRSDDEIEELIRLQTEIVERPRDHRSGFWPQAMNLLGDAYSDRAERHDDPLAQADDLASALNAYRQALEASGPDDERRLVYAVDTANMMVVHAAVTRSGGPATLDAATKLIVHALGTTPGDPSRHLSVMPVLRSRLRGIGL